MAKSLKIGYLDTISGISGDMLLGALVDVGVPFSLLEDVIRSFHIPHLELTRQEVNKNGFRACKVDVKIPHEHKHRHLSEILDMIGRSSLSSKAKEIASDMFKRIAKAEAFVHGTTPDEVHFHEVGASDSIADIAGIAAGFDHLQFDKLYSSSVPTGTGKIRIAHGICSIPAPATAELLKGIPIAPSDIPFELTTPTGAAALASLVSEYGPIPEMVIEQIGVGAGTRDYEQQPNILRILKGTLPPKGDDALEEELWMLETNLDDASGEAVGYLQERLRSVNPKEVFTTSVQMKKSRPGTKISVLADSTQVEHIENIFFEETPTLGVRRYMVHRSTLSRKQIEVSTRWGSVSGKMAIVPGKSNRFKPEYEDIRQIAMKYNVPLHIVNQEALHAFRQKFESAES